MVGRCVRPTGALLDNPKNWSRFLGMYCTVDMGERREYLRIGVLWVCALDGHTPTLHIEQNLTQYNAI